MEELVKEKLDILIDALKNSPLIKDYHKLKKEIEDNDEYLVLIKKYQEVLAISSKEAVNIKKEIFQIPVLKNFYKRENEIDLLLLEINKTLEIR